MRFDGEFVALNVDVTAVTSEEIEGILEQYNINIGEQNVVATAQHVENGHRFHVHLIGE